MKLIKKHFYNIFLCISISFILKLLLLNTYGDYSLENEWGILFNNLKNFKVLSYRSFEGNLIPSVYMPPLYVYFIFIIDFLKPEIFDLVKSILFTQILLSSISVYYFYKINVILFNKKLSIISSYIFVLFPLHIYSSIQISSISLQIFLNILFLYLIIRIIKNKIDTKIIILLSIISGMTILLRGEFILIFIFTLFFLLYVKKIKFFNLITLILITSLAISPYLVRNYMQFKKITVTKSFGYNLWKGNNFDATVEGSETIIAFEKDNIYKKVNNLEKDKMFDFNYDEIFFKSSVKFIKEEPVLFISRYLKKFLTFTFFNFDSNYPNYYNILNILSLILLSLFFLPSIIFLFKKKKTIDIEYLYFNLFITISIFSVFFILPRYKLIILPIQLILINFWLEKYFKKGRVVQW